MRIVIFLAGVTALSFAQNRFLAEGRILGGNPGGGLSVEVSEGSGKIRLAAVPVYADSSFQIELPSDQRAVEFRVVNRYGEVIQVSQQWPQRGGVIELRLTSGSSSPKAGGAISLKRLAFRPPPKIRKAFETSRKLNAAGRKAESLEALQDIVRAQPAWFDAWVELGTRQTVLGQHRAAVVSLGQALAIDPNAAEVYPALGLALLRSALFAEARRTAQRALELNPDCHTSKYVLGLAMASTRQSSPRAVALLDEVQAYFPEAMVALAGLLLRDGQYEASRDTAWRYLHMGRAPRAELATSIWREASLRLPPNDRP